MKELSIWDMDTSGAGDNTSIRLTENNITLIFNKLNEVARNIQLLKEQSQ